MAALSSFAVGDTVYTCDLDGVLNWTVEKLHGATYLLGHGRHYYAAEAFATQQEAIEGARKDVRDAIEVEQKKIGDLHAQLRTLNMIEEDVVRDAAEGIA